MQAVPFHTNITQGVKIGGIQSEVFYFRAVATGYVLRLNSRTLQVVPWAGTTQAVMARGGLRKQWVLCVCGCPACRH